MIDMETKALAYLWAGIERLRADGADQREIIDAWKTKADQRADRIAKQQDEIERLRQLITKARTMLANGEPYGHIAVVLERSKQSYGADQGNG